MPKQTIIEEGLLLVDKPCGLSSNKVLQQVRHFLLHIKAGHGGSLDPLASGMLPIFLGRATKFSRFLLEAPKSYRVIACLGATTTTGDVEGAIVKRSEVPSFTIEQIVASLQTFVGVQEQVPPLYSALKLEGKPLYAYARQGISVTPKARTIEVHDLRFLAFQNDLVSFEVSCSKGTYIRSLVESLGERLGCGAHTVHLRRLSVAGFEAHRMIALDTLLGLELDKVAEQVISIENLVQTLPAWRFCKEDWEAVRTGRVPSQDPAMDGWFRIYDPSGFKGVIRFEAQRIQERCFYFN